MVDTKIVEKHGVKYNKKILNWLLGNSVILMFQFAHSSNHLFND